QFPVPLRVVVEHHGEGRDPTERIHFSDARTLPPKHGLDGHCRLLDDPWDGRGAGHGGPLRYQRQADWSAERPPSSEDPMRALFLTALLPLAACATHDAAAGTRPAPVTHAGAMKPV